MKATLRLLVCLLLLALPVQAGQQGTIVRQAPVYSKPSISSQPVGNARAGIRVDLLERRGGWQEIYSAEKELAGWVRVFQVREGDFNSTVITENEEDSRGFLSGLASLSRKASGFFSHDTEVTSSSTATIGVRGLSEAEINSASADFEELEKMKTYASKKGRMKKFTRTGPLKPDKVPYISGAKQ